MALSGISDLSPFKRRRQEADELEALLDLLPHPTLIANARNGRILFANAQATQLTAYTRKEFAELETSTLLPGLDPKKLAALSSESILPHQQKLIKRSSQSMSIALAVHPLGGPEHWVALTLQPLAALQGDLAGRGRLDQRWEGLHVLSLAAQQPELSSCYRQILQAGNLLTAAAHLALFAPPGAAGGLKLQAIWGAGVDFPSELQTTDLAHLRTPRVWEPGKPIDSSLHKLAHAQKLSYLATTPLDLTQPETGLLVVADPETNPASELITLMQILAASAATATLNHALLKESRTQIERLSLSHALSRALYESAEDGVFRVDRNLDLIEMNPTAETMLGYTSDETVGRPVNDILISTQALLSTLESALLSDHPLDLGELKLHRRDGSDFLAHLRISPILQEDVVSQMAILVSDLSEHEAFHLRSQQLQQRAWLGEVTAIFAHEVRNPINNISTGLQLMATDFPEDDPLQEQIKRLQEDCDRLEHRMKSVLSFSRTLEQNPEPIDIGEFCHMQLERWRPRMARKNIESNLQVAPGILPILGDRRSLDQVFTNLITNAIQAMDGPGGGVLAIKIKPADGERTGEYVDIHISDTGPGIPEDLRQRVFDPFFTTKIEEGTGLGLAITRRIIMAHKGEIKLESFPGGTLFKIQLPVTQTNPNEGNHPE